MARDIPAGLTYHVRAGAVCVCPQRNHLICPNRTWERCAQCDAAICGRHIITHYRRTHPRLI